MATCPTCEAEFTPKPNHHPVPRYCQRACKERASARRRRTPVVAANRAAREAAKAQRPPAQPRVCPECGAELAEPRVRLCSDACRRARKERYDREYNRTHRPGTPQGCGRCGVPLPVGRKSCDPCLHLIKRARKRQGKRRRRAMKLGVPSEPYTLAEIAARDRFTCQLCHKRVAMTKAVPHAKAATIDHVVPLADGGDDTRANVQLAHFECNWRKADHGTQQLALIG